MPLVLYAVTLFVLLDNPATRFPDDDTATASPLFAKVTKTDAQNGRIWYTWHWYKGVRRLTVEKKDGVIHTRSDVTLVVTPRSAVFESPGGQAFSGDGKKLDTIDAIKHLKTGSIVLVLFQSSDLDPRQLGVLAPSAIILVQPTPDARTIANLLSERQK